MSKIYYRVQRGMVFWFDPDVYGTHSTYTAYNRREVPTNLQLRKRPWVVVSTNSGNNSATTCNIVPITSELKTELPCHVQFTFEGRPQTIMVEQIRTADIDALNMYMYTLADEVMLKIERAMMTQFEIRTPESTLELQVNVLVSKLEEFVLQKLNAKFVTPPTQTVSETQIEDAALRLGLHIETLLADIQPKVEQPVEQPKVEQPKAEQPKAEQPVEQPVEQSQSVTKHPKSLSQIEKFNRKYSPPQQKVTNSDTLKKNKWTVEMRQQFIRDCDNMSSREVMEKYNLKSIKSVFSTKYVHKNFLNNNVKGE